MLSWLAIVVLSASPAGSNFGLTVGDSGSPGPRPTPVAPAQNPAPTCGPQRQPADRTCAVDADCVAVRVNLDCCGTQAVRGVSRADAARFQAQERLCSPGRRCGCESGPTRLDDGSRWEHDRAVLVACRERVCTTFLAPVPATSPEPCSRAECGPAPAMPNWTCPDGVNVAGRGPCLRVNGRCGWTRLECP